MGQISIIVIWSFGGSFCSGLSSPFRFTFLWCRFWSSHGLAFPPLGFLRPTTSDTIVFFYEIFCALPSRINWYISRISGIMQKHTAGSPPVPWSHLQGHRTLSISLAGGEFPISASAMATPFATMRYEKVWLCAHSSRSHDRGSFQRHSCSC